MILDWIGFNIFIILILVLDLVVFRKKAHEVTLKETLAWSSFWIGLALLFAVYVYFRMGQESAVNFLTGYVIEKTLSVDNLFVFLVLFSFFRVPENAMHKVLFWGVLGAIVMRAIFILVGITLVQKFHFFIYILGAFLLFTGIRFLSTKEKKIDPQKNFVYRLLLRYLPITHEYDDTRFFVVRNHRLLATPLFLVLVMIELTDVVFAVDSIPAILAITLDPFIVYTSNIFAIIGLRTLFFALAGLIKLFTFLHYGIAVILIFVGAKMIVSEWIKISPLITLSVVILILAISIGISVFFSRKEPK